MFHWIMMFGCRNRLFEWVMAIILTWLGLKLIVYPNLVAHSTFRMLLVLVTPLGLAWILFILGVARATVLAIDGHYLINWTPGLRSATSLVCALVWAQMAMALEMISAQQGTVTIGSPVYWGLMLGEIFSCYRTLARPGNGAT